MTNINASAISPTASLPLNANTHPAGDDIARMSDVELESTIDRLRSEQDQLPKRSSHAAIFDVGKKGIPFGAALGGILGAIDAGLALGLGSGGLPPGVKAWTRIPRALAILTVGVGIGAGLGFSAGIGLGVFIDSWGFGMPTAEQKKLSRTLNLATTEQTNRAAGLVALGARWEHGAAIRANLLIKRLDSNHDGRLSTKPGYDERLAGSSRGSTPRAKDSVESYAPLHLAQSADGPWVDNDSLTSALISYLDVDSDGVASKAERERFLAVESQRGFGREVPVTGMRGWGDYADFRAGLN